MMPMSMNACLQVKNSGTKSLFEDLKELCVEHTLLIRCNEQGQPQADWDAALEPVPLCACGQHAPQQCVQEAVQGTAFCADCDPDHGFCECSCEPCWENSVKCKCTFVQGATRVRCNYLAVHNTGYCGDCFPCEAHRVNFCDACGYTCGCSCYFCSANARWVTRRSLYARINRVEDMARRQHET